MQNIFQSAMPNRNPMGELSNPMGVLKWNQNTRSWNHYLGWRHEEHPAVQSSSCIVIHTMYENEIYDKMKKTKNKQKKPAKSTNPHYNKELARAGWILYNGVPVYF